MEKKKIAYIIGGLAIIGGIIYFINKNKSKEKTYLDDSDAKIDSVDNTKDKSKEKNDSIDDTTDVKPVPRPVPRPTSQIEMPIRRTPVKKLNADELEMRLQSSCGKKPSRKKNKLLYDQCRSRLTAKLKAEGFISFDGNYKYENVVDYNLFSSFDSNLDLNL